MVIFTWIHNNWVSLVALGWAIEKALEILGQLTHWNKIDNLGILLATILQRVSNRPTQAK